MKYLIAILSLVAIFGSQTRAAPPNILVIYSDDHGWADLGVQGVDPDIRTPHLDQLAKDGVRCTRGYVSAPQCVPSRAGVLTGRYQQRFGLEDNNKGALPLAELTIAERLKPAGYVTGQVGKWHLDLRAEVMGAGKKDRSALVEHMPHGQGFDEYFRGELTKFYASHDLKNRPFADAPHVVEDRRFRVDVQTEAALAFLSRREAKPEQPWFLYLAYFTPHVPLESPEPWFSKTPAHLPRERRQALAMMAAMDDGIGQVRAKLKAMGQSENTLLLLTATTALPVTKATGTAA
jgi:arylsulfatase A-like enzyme